MLRRFSLYGFLKNQRYFEPFLILAFQEKGLDFFQIGLLIAFREIVVVLLEIPSGAFADLYGRRFAMILSFVSYIVSFVVFGLAANVALLMAAMFFFAIGDAFRTGTHKALIFSWLQAEGREEERVRVYGYTRSWSKFGSALSVVLAGLLVFVGGSYSWIFFLSIPPYVVGIVNFLGYPKYLDEAGAVTAPSLRSVARYTWESVETSVRHGGLRRLMIEAMGFGGVFHAVKDYIQPAIEVAVVGVAGTWPEAAALSREQQVALAVAAVYLLLHLMSGVASRRARWVVDRTGDENSATRWIWGVTLATFVVLGLAALDARPVVLVLPFVVLHVVQNLWRPILVSRFSELSPQGQAATILSVESQARRVATMVLAPAIGLAIDVAAGAGTGHEFWPVGAIGAVVAGLLWVTGPRSARSS